MGAQNQNGNLQIRNTHESFTNHCHNPAWFSLQVFLSKWVLLLKSDLIGKDLGDLLWDLMLMRSLSTIDQQILYHATKLSHVVGPSTTLKEDNLSEEFLLTHEIDCVNVNPITTACWQTTGKTGGPTFFTAGITTVAVTCSRSRIENNPSNP